MQKIKPVVWIQPGDSPWDILARCMIALSHVGMGDEAQQLRITVRHAVYLSEQLEALEAACELRWPSR
jgi:hypothetical protein